MIYRVYQGFTLIELIIAVAVLAILAAIAVPSYRSHICKLERNQAQADLLAFAQQLEQFYTANNFKYLDASGDLPSVFPAYSPAQRTAADRRYSLSATVPSSNDSFVVSAERVAGSCDAETFTLTNTGVRQWIKAGVTLADWGK